MLADHRLERIDLAFDYEARTAVEGDWYAAHFDIAPIVHCIASRFPVLKLLLIALHRPPTALSLAAQPGPVSSYVSELKDDWKEESLSSILLMSPASIAFTTEDVDSFIVEAPSSPVVPL